MEELDLKEIFNIFWKRKIGIIIILLLAIIIGSIYSFYMIKPVYTSYTSLLLIPEDNVIRNEDGTITKRDFTLNSELAETYEELIKSKDILKQVVEELQIKDLNEATIKNNIQVSAVTETGLIKISVTNQNPEYAAQIANKTAEIFDKEIADTYIENNVSIIDKAEVSTDPSNINHKKDLLVFVFIGIVIACGYALVKYMWENSSKK